MTSRAFALFAALTVLAGLLAPLPSAADPPSVTGITPASGTTHGGTVLTLRGSNFLPGTQVQLVMNYQGHETRLTASGVQVRNGTEIRAVTPPAPPGFAGLVSVILNSPDGSQIVSPGGFTYTAAAAPILASVQPNSGTALGNEVVVLTGSGFSTTIPPRVLFGSKVVGGVVVQGTPATVIPPLLPNRITVLSPGRGAVGGVGASVNITLQNPDGSALTSLSHAYTYITQNRPTITGVGPASTGSSNGGTVLTLTGLGFAPGANVTFLSHANLAVQAPAAAVLFTGSNQLKVTTPSINDTVGDTPLPTGQGLIDIKVTNPDGRDATVIQAFGFSLASRPTVGRVQPSEGPEAGGTRVTITGSSFAPGPGLQVLFGPHPATDVQFVSPTNLTAVVPECDGCAAVQVRVRNPDGQMQVASNSVTFTYRRMMLIESIRTAVSAPSEDVDVMSNGLPVGASSRTLTLAGVGLPSACRVFVGNVEVNATTVECAGPDGTTVSFEAPKSLRGRQDVRVAGADGRSAVLQNAISYSLGPVPAIGTVAVVEPLPGGFASSNAAIGETPQYLLIQGSGFVVEQNGSAFVSPTVTVKAGSTTVPAALDPTFPQSSTQLRVRLPPLTERYTTAYTGTGCKNDTCNGTVTVQNRDGQSVAAATEDRFVYKRAFKPQFQPCFECPTGPTNGGQLVVVEGRNFALGARVGFGSAGTVVVDQPCIPAPPALSPSCIASDEQLRVLVPPTSGSGGTVKLAIRNPDTQDAGPTTDIAQDHFSYVYTAPNSFSPSAQTTSFPSNGGPLAIRSGASPFTFGKDLKVMVGTITIPACIGKVTRDCIAPEDIRSSSDPDTPTVSGDLLRVVVPGRVGSASGTLQLTVTNANGQSAPAGTLSFGTRVLPNFSTTAAFTPSTGSAGSIVKLTGSNFAFTGRPPVVTVGGVAAEVCTSEAMCPAALSPPDPCIPSTATCLLFKVPARAAPGTGSIVLTNPDGGSAQVLGFRVLSLPRGVSVSPSLDTVNGGATITLTGTGFRSDPPVVPLFARQQADYREAGQPLTVSSDTAATALVPPVPSEGAAFLYLVDQFGQSLGIPSAFNFLVAIPPSFHSVTPSLVSVNGGTEVTVAGTGFSPGASVCMRRVPVPALAFGEAPRACTRQGDDADGLLSTTWASQNGVTTLRFIAPSHAAGPLDLVITNPGGNAADTANSTLVVQGKESRFAYTQTAGPIIDSVTPSTGDVAGGTTITIAGANFAGTPTVTLNGTAATDVTLVSSTAITAKTPRGRAGPATVTVTVSGLSVSKPNAFTYTGVEPDPTTTTPPPPTTTSTTTTAPPTTTAPVNVTAAQVMAANQAVVVTVTRDGDDNVVNFTLPANLPAVPAGVQIFRSTSPYVLLQTLAVGTPAYNARSYRDADADADASYRVTIYYAGSVGKAITGPADVPGFDNLPESSVQGQGISLGLAIGLGLGLLALVAAVVVAVLLLRRRGQASPATVGGDVGYVAPQEPAPVEDPAQPQGPKHNVNCPACRTTFEAVGEKPLRMRCPNCGREGILR